MTPKEFTTAKLEFFDRLSLDHPLTALQCRVAWRIVTRTNIENDGCAWPSYETIAGEIGCHSDSVKRSVSHLCALGWLRKVSPRGPA